MLNRILQSALEGSAPDSLTDEELEELEAKEQVGKGLVASQVEKPDLSGAHFEASTAKNKTSPSNHPFGRRMNMGEGAIDEPKEEAE